ncbi:YafY family transcriptional regulator [Leisingera sp. HS039]|uniref:helix-turn-helix transcriptional regulator n=1 Tax=unclassified Leisingera TaxID=2614906 RepID=UPI0010710D9B|nr:MULTISPECIES: YafY family protein [unclassified Leisingera]MBQ4825580.1 YafY family transcriptional regulator [Leisingera sp. HS039]QBR37963.1 YafY family transcriptional regulator [Leisingera sp. NJS201]
MSRTHRLFQLMQAMRLGPGPHTAARLGDELGVSARSIHRDIATLREMGAVIDGAAGYGFTLIEDNALPPMGFRDTELEALVLGLREVEQIGDPELATAASEALRKLQARLPPRQAHRLRHAVLAPYRFDRPIPPAISAQELRQATWDEVEVRFGYTDGHGAVTERQVKPLSVVYFDRSTVLIAWCCLREAIRVFRLDRMQTLQVTGQSFRPHRVPMLRDALKQFRQEHRQAARRTFND